MVVKVRIKGLNTVHNRRSGKWYVYVRSTGECLLSGFEGSKEALQRRMEQPDFIAIYNARRVQSIKRTYPDGTLGSLVEWYTGTAPEYAKLAEATKQDYQAAYDWLAPEFDCRLEDIDQASIYDVRDKCAAEKWPRFADKMVSALSSMFRRAVRRGKMRHNPALGIEKIAKADPNRNREWKPWEQEQVFTTAPPHILTPLMIARYAGYRGQTIQALTWRDYQNDPLTGKAFTLVSPKNDEILWLPIVPALQAHLSSIDVTSTFICTRKNGTPWPDEKKMQAAVSHFLKRMEREGKANPGITLHGLRVTFAAALRRDGADRGMVASALGDRSERMGAHYTRHVEREKQVIAAMRSQL